MSGTLVENIGGGLVVVQTDNRTSAEIAQQEHTRPGPALVVAGTGGKRLRFHDGREVVIGGEALRIALRKRRITKPFIAGDVINNGKEIVIDVALLNNWLNRGAKDLGPACVIVGEEPVQFTHGPSVAEQHGQSAAAMKSAIDAGAKNPDQKFRK